jgi:nitroimidazol reductase NimA-like FMN-containing flavoprotein (pyridoxamine 5'-phosphate oxidase superfamily)
MEKAQIEAIIHQATVCRLGLFDGSSPYIVPLCFGYRDDALYFHTGPRSRKLDMIRRHPRVCFEMDILAGPMPAAAPCDWNMDYQSVVGFGSASIVEATAAKQAALAVIMDQYTQGPYTFPENKLAITAVIKVAVESMTGKRSKVGAGPV